jgi:hypothetical protein
VTRLFESYAEARDAVQALRASGVSPSAISAVTRSPEDAETLERDAGTSDDLEDASHRGRLDEFVGWLGRLESAAVPGFGAMLGTGDLWQDVQLGGQGRGSITGALVGCGVTVDEAAQLEQAVFEGRILLVVHGSYDRAAVDKALS